MIGRTNAGGGGGGGLSPNSAVIHVTAPAGSTISFAKGGVVAKVLGPEKSHVSATDASLADWYFSVNANNYGTWTVTATLGTDTASDTVTISENKQYDLMLLYLMPEGYQAVEYIQDSGSAYINTGISLPGDNFEIYLKAQRLQSSSGEMYLASTFGGSYQYFDIQLRSNELDFYFNGHHVDGASAITGLPFEAFLSRSGSTWSYHINTNPVKTGTYAATGNTNNVQFFRSNTGKGTAGNRIMRCTIKESGVIVGDYIPCYRKSDSVPGMWDDATDSFLTNSAGSGTFIVGPDV